MTQQTITQEGALQYTNRTQINENFTELYTGYTGRVQTVRQSADVTATTNVTLANLTGLVHTLAVGTYKIRVALQCLSTANGGTKVAFNYTAPTSIQLQVEAKTTTALANSRFTTTTDQASIVAATVANTSIVMEGTIVVATAGTIQVQGAQNASHSDTTTYYTGSSFSIQKIA